MISRRALLLSTPAVLLPTGAAHAQAYPQQKPIRYIVPVAPGGGSDFIGRTVCERWAKALGQTIVVDNLGGGGGVIAAQATVKAAPDGYTLMQGYVATHGTSPATRKLPAAFAVLVAGRRLALVSRALVGGPPLGMFPEPPARSPPTRPGPARRSRPR